MNANKYNGTIYLITATIVATIAVQLFWNYRNYQENKLRVKADIQVSLDKAIDEYYSALSKDNFFAVYDNDSIQIGKRNFNGFWRGNSKNGKAKFQISSIEIKTDDPKEYAKMPSILDSLFFKDSVISKGFKEKHSNRKVTFQPYQFVKRESISDSLRVAKGIRSIIIALNTDKINFTSMDSLFANQLEKKGVATEHYISLYEYDSLKQTSAKKDTTLTLFADASSSYLRQHQNLRAYYKDPTITALKKSTGGILISLVLCLIIVATLFYLLKIIRQQKELAAIKNDLISNITHEFKTPIATVATAIEAMTNFDVTNNKEKTQKYLSMSSGQLKKLHQMVEKLLETATLDSEQLMLKKEKLNLVEFVQRIVQKHEMIGTDKQLRFESDTQELWVHVDTFHIENAISNLIDNALKYGGEQVSISLEQQKNHAIIRVSDNGLGIDTQQLEKIFDKFYRVPKGNTHDVKGFGIGLYYTQKIVEKHAGLIQVQSNPTLTTFAIHLPYED